jgi:hypothetical protein
MTSTADTSNEDRRYYCTYCGTQRIGVYSDHETCWERLPGGFHRWDRSAAVTSTQAEQ